MTDNDTNPYLQAETFQQEVKGGLRAWSEHLAPQAGSGGRSRSRQRRAGPGAESAEVEDEDAAAGHLVGGVAG